MVISHGPYLIAADQLQNLAGHHPHEASPAKQL